MAATVVDSLVVLLGLDPTKFSEGQKKALADLRGVRDDATKTGKHLEQAGKDGAVFFLEMEKAARRFFTVAAGYEMLKWTTHVIEGVAALGRSARNLGMSTQVLYAFGKMAEMAGGNLAEAAQSFGTMTQAVQQYVLTGQMSDQMLGARGLIGVSPTASPEEVYRRFNVWAQGKPPQFANLVGGYLGLSQGMINEALKPVAEFNANFGQMRKNWNLTKEDVDNARKFQAAMVGASAAIDNLARSLLPMMTKFLTWAANLINRDADAIRWFSKNPVDVRLPGAAPVTPPSIPRGTGGAGAALLPLVRRLEGSGDTAVSPKGAIGRNQIMPATARAYGFDPSRLKDPAYNDMVAVAILNDLNARYHGNVDQILAAYNGGTRAAQSEAAFGDPGNAETRAYLAHAHRILAKSGGAVGGVSNVVNIQTMTINTQATDATGIARDIKSELRKKNKNLDLATQANVGMQ